MVDAGEQREAQQVVVQVEHGVEVQGRGRVIEVRVEVVHGGLREHLEVDGDVSVRAYVVGAAAHRKHDVHVQHLDRALGVDV